MPVQTKEEKIASLRKAIFNKTELLEVVRDSTLTGSLKTELFIIQQNDIIILQNELILLAMENKF